MTTARDFHRAWRALPLGSINDIIGDGSALILAPHPDDESLGCGGLVAACVAAGRAPLVVILTDGTQSHPNSRTFPQDRLRSVRTHEAQDAVAHLGLPADRILFLGQPDAAAPHDGPVFAAVANALTTLIQWEAHCTAILAPWLYDPHCDHEAASRIATEVARHAQIHLVSYPVWGWTLPLDASLPAPIERGWRLNIAPWLPQKRRAILAHRTQYGGLITDDPTGFQLPPDLLSVFDSPYETFLLS